MPQREYQDLPLKQYFSQFFGGLQTQEEAEKIDDWGSPDTLNCRPVGKGAYGPRNGITRVGNEVTGAGSRSGIYNFFRKNLETLISPTGTSLQYLKANGDWANLPGSGAYTDGAQFGFANDTKYLYFCNGVDDFGIWDGKDLTATFTADDTTDIITSTAHGLELNDIVVLTTSGTLPAGLSLNTKYYVVTVTTNTFKLATSFSGTPIDITNTGSGTHTFSSSINTFSNNPKGNIFQFYLNRLYIAGGAMASGLVAYSVINVLGANPSYDFASAGSGSFLVGDNGDPVTALRTFRSPTTGKKTLYIFKQFTQVYEQYFDDSGTRLLQEVKSGTGALNAKSTIDVENDIIYIDDGNNIANMGFRENITDELRTDSTTTGLDRTTTGLDFSNACGVYWKKRKIALYCGRDFQAENNNFVLAYFYDFKSWWRWSGINANQFAIYQNEIVWASSTDKNAYKYDESKFDDNDGAIQSYRATKDVSYTDRNGISLADRYKKARFVTIRGYISPAAVLEESTNDDKRMYIHVIYDGLNEQKVSQFFSGDDEDITTENFSVYFGANIFGSQAFGGSALSPTAFPLREFFAVVSLDYYSNFRIRVLPQIQGAGVPYLITHIAIWSELTPEEQWADGNKI